MREVFSDFMMLDRRPDGTVRIPLGAEEATNDLAGLVNGEHVRVVYPGELMAEAIVESEQVRGWTVWYAIVPNMDAIVVLDLDASDDTNTASAPLAHG